MGLPKKDQKWGLSVKETSERNVHGLFRAIWKIDIPVRARMVRRASAGITELTCRLGSYGAKLTVDRADRVTGQIHRQWTISNPLRSMTVSCESKSQFHGSRSRSVQRLLSWA
jgi:hypothetical protein